jgi:hypothetical protein|nr:MAG TPA: hypothetical protein [Caudoviricetes sp.]
MVYEVNCKNLEETAVYKLDIYKEQNRKKEDRSFNEVYVISKELLTLPHLERNFEYYESLSKNKFVTNILKYAELKNDSYVTLEYAGAHCLFKIIRSDRDLSSVYIKALKDEKYYSEKLIDALRNTFDRLGFKEYIYLPYKEPVIRNEKCAGGENELLEKVKIAKIILKTSKK